MAPRAVKICFAFIRSIPVVFITAVIGWSYYAYVIQMCIFTVPHLVEKVVYLIVFHALFLMMCWCYWKTIFTPVAVTPKQFYLTRSDLTRFERELSQTNRREMLMQAARQLPMQCRTITGEMRYCDKCKALKPDRAHHCSVCGKCILKMDHHCPWVNNCVCFSNYKFFILFLAYSLLYCVFVSLTSLQFFISFWTGVGDGNVPIANLHIVFLFFAGVMFAISLMSLFGYHSFLVSRNRSTLESFQTPIFATGPDKNGFNLGCRRNFLEIFGDDRRLWFLPKFTSDSERNGIVYPSRAAGRSSPGGHSYHSMELTVGSVVMQPDSEAREMSHGNGLSYPVRTVDEDYDNLLGERQRWAEEGGDADEPTVGYYDGEGTRLNERS